MKIWIPISMVLLALTGPLFGQAAPTATETMSSAPVGSTPSPRLSWIDGTVHYSLTGTEAVQVGYYGPGTVTSSTSVSGLVGYSSLSQVHPTSLLLGSGVILGQGGQGTTGFVNFAITQTLIKGRWVFMANNSFSFLPQSPVGGVSGIPGINDSGLDGPSGGPAGGLLSNTGNRISEMVNGSVERRLTGRTSISGSGAWSILHFLNKNQGLDTKNASAQLAFNYRLSPRNSMSVSGVYSRFNTYNLFNFFPPGFPQDNVTYQTRGINGSFTRQWTRALSTNISAGPMWIESSAAPLIPNQLNFYLNAGLNYNRRRDNYSVQYMHGVSGGSGVQPGALSDSVNGVATRNLNEFWAVSATMVYTRTSGLVANVPGLGSFSGASNTEYGTLQVSRGFTRTVSGYASYTAQNQSLFQGYLAPNAYTGLSHVFAIGISWTPQSNRLGEF